VIHKPALVLHGGAWDIPKSEVADHEKGIRTALDAGWAMLHRGEKALDVVEEAVVIMENDPTFDAGKGSILNVDGSVEMDASIMDGQRFDAGAVAALRNFPNPIRIARRVLEKTDHILLAGEGCEIFARSQGFQSVPIEELLTPRELKRLEMLIKDRTFKTPHAFGGKRGTVGAVALDCEGNVAAATSTGGTPKKIPGRVGDSPIIGCGTFAENGVGAVSCTGWGEAIMKVMLAGVVAEKMRSGNTAEEAAAAGIKVLQDRVQGLGGIICIDFNGHIGIDYNTPRMARGFMQEGLKKPVAAV
jgi:beta-aspartyl-peptidase (threonine type)